MLPPHQIDEQIVPDPLGIIFEDDFDKCDIDTTKWYPYYLPHWSTLEASLARFHIADSVLRLTIAEDQHAWCSEPIGQTRVSGMQTGHFSGPINGPLGQHRFRGGLRVRQDLPELRLFLPKFCRLEMKSRAKLNPYNLAALWLIGFEDSPERSGEITVFEAFGDRSGTTTSSIGRGIKKINDPTLTDEIDDGILPVNIEDWHVYTMDWTPMGVHFYVDGERVTTTTQSPSYPMQLMLNFYELPGRGVQTSGEEAWFDIDYIRAYGWST